MNKRRRDRRARTYYRVDGTSVQPSVASAFRGGSLRRPVAAVAAVLAVVLIGERLLGTGLASRQATGELPAWLPQFGALDQTVVAYATLFDLLKFVVLPAALVWVGYAYGRYRADSEK